MTLTSTSRSLRADTSHAAAAEYLAYPLRDSPIFTTFRLMRALSILRSTRQRNTADERRPAHASVPPADARLKNQSAFKRDQGRRGALRHPRGHGWSRG